MCACKVTEQLIEPIHCKISTLFQNMSNLIRAAKLLNQNVLIIANLERLNF